MRSSRGVLALVGPMGAGKSTIGKCLAQLLNRNFLDTDSEIETSCGAEIPWIFDVEGEEGFRARESQMLEKISAEEDIVLATGGGIILKEQNRKILRSMSLVIYLTAPIEALLRRVAKDSTRPLLQVENPKQAYADIFMERDPLYREIADIVFISDFNSSSKKVAHALKNKIECF